MLGEPCAHVGIWIRKPLCPTVSLWHCLSPTGWMTAPSPSVPELWKMNSVAAAHLWPSLSVSARVLSLFSVQAVLVRGWWCQPLALHLHLSHHVPWLCAGILGFTQAFSLPAHKSDGMNCTKSGAACDWHLKWQWEEKGWYLAYPCCAWVYSGWQTLLQWKPVLSNSPKYMVHCSDA